MVYRSGSVNLHIAGHDSFETIGCWEDSDEQRDQILPLSGMGNNLMNGLGIRFACRSRCQ